jgi:hypothetical protein
MTHSQALEHDARVLVSALLLFTTLCLVCSALTVAVQLFAPRPTAASDSLIAICAWSRNGSVGLWWNTQRPPSQVFARAPHYNAVCALVPWSAALPERGIPKLDFTP